jgi:hypothetical protein
MTDGWRASRVFLLFMVNQAPDPDRLDGLLRSWTGAPAPTGGLDAPVWRRIEARSARLTWGKRLTDVLHALDVRLALPQALAALVALSLALGLGGGIPPFPSRNPPEVS